MPSPREVELKLELAPKARGPTKRARIAMRRLNGLEQDGETRHFVSAIYDTEDHALRKRGLVLRIRRDGERRIQTLKADLGAGALERGEWESDIAADTPDLAMIPDEALRQEVRDAGPLAPVLETEFDRTLWRIRHHGSDVELALDEGTIRANGHEARIDEIEIELKSGAPTALFEIAREIVGVVHARPGMKSKSERGYDLLEGASTKAEPFQVTRKMSVGVAFQVIVRACLRQYLIHEPGIILRDAESLHKGRVAIRRLRSCLKLHKKLIADEEGERLKKGLRRLSQDLGAARNLDVYLDRIEAGTAPSGHRPRVQEERERVYDRLIGKLRSKAMRVLVLDVMAYAETGTWLRDPARRKLREMKVRTFASKTLGKRWRRLRKDGKNLGGRTPEARHEVRIEGKVLRYASEFFAGAFPGRKRRRHREELLEALADLQGHLGDLNDIEVGTSVTPNPPDAGTDRKADQARVPDLIAAAQKAHRRIKRAEPFWA